MKVPEFEVVTRRPWRRITIIAVVSIIGVVSLVLGYALGYNRVTTDRVSKFLLDRELEESRVEIERLEGELIDVTLVRDVQREAADELREDLAEMHKENQGLAEEVTFYKSLMAPGDLPRGLEIAELEIRLLEGQPHKARFELLLTQAATRRTFIGGVVRMDVIGRQAAPLLEQESIAVAAAQGLADDDDASAELGGEAATTDNDDEVVLSLTEIADVESYPLKFRFRYFQDLAGDMSLPEGFTPERVLVTAQQNGQEPLQATFPWPQDEVESGQ